MVISYLRRSSLGPRLRSRLWELSSHDRPRDEGCAADIDDLALSQIDTWTHGKIGAGTHADLTALNERFPSIYVLRIDRGRAKIAAKPSFFIPPRERSSYRRMFGDFARRILYYKLFIEAVVAKLCPDLSTTLAIDVGDIGLEGSDAPLFAFQKKIGSPNILLPDVDFFSWNWYARPRDRIAYEDKKIIAGFVGSSTGGTDGAGTGIYTLGERAIREGLNPRLRAAAHFVGSPLVDFRIAKAVQTDRPETKSLLESQPYFSRPVHWRAQFRNRFLISIDGNGAACSRLAVGLKSRAVVIKYDSSFSLFYFPKMMPGREFLAVSSEAEVERVVETERMNPGTYKPVAEAGRRFFSRYLERDRVMEYAATLFRHYADLHG